jgi:hypothetical protein
VTAVIKSVTFDAVDALALARFWAAALGSDVDEASTAGKAFVAAVLHRFPHNVVMADPEGNEFCVEPGPA